MPARAATGAGDAVVLDDAGVGGAAARERGILFRNRGDVVEMAPPLRRDVPCYRNQVPNLNNAQTGAGP